MSPAQPEWPDFIERLAGPEACDVGGDGTLRCRNDTRGTEAILRRILAGRPPAGSSIVFEQEFESACMELVDALQPEGVEVRRYLAAQIPGEADARVVDELLRARERAAE